MFDVKVIAAEAPTVAVVNLDNYTRLCKNYHKKADNWKVEFRETQKTRIATELASILKYYAASYEVNVGSDVTNNIDQIMVYITELDTFKQYTNLVDLGLFNQMLLEVFNSD